MTWMLAADTVAVVGGFVCLALVFFLGLMAFLFTRRPKREPFGRPPEHPDDQPPGGY